MFEAIEQFIRENEDEIKMGVVFFFVILVLTIAQAYITWVGL